MEERKIDVKKPCGSKKKIISQTKLQRRLERVHGKEGPGIGHVSHASSGLRSGGKKTLLLSFYLFIPMIYALVVRARRAAFRSRSRRFPPSHNHRRRCRREFAGPK